MAGIKRGAAPVVAVIAAYPKINSSIFGPQRARAGPDSSVARPLLCITKRLTTQLLISFNFHPAAVLIGNELSIK
jgi:hypothetical protein